MKLFESFQLGPFELSNRVVMAPMTRSRAIGNIPNDLMAKYYEQRADAGLIITEGTAPSDNGLGYPRIPGCFNAEQAAGWKKVTDAVHAKGGKIFLQIMHTGRVSHPLNMAEGARVVGPSAVQLSGEMYTDQQGPQPYPLNEEMTADDIIAAQDEFVNTARHAIQAGFDGVEIHGANGYLVDQFLNPASNLRTDNYGGSVENRARFAIETAKKVVAEIGAERTGIRLSPYGVFNDMAIYEGIDDLFLYLAGELGNLNLAYVHIVDHSGMGAPAVPASIKEGIRDAFGGTTIIGGGLDAETAEAQLQAGLGHLAFFGRPYVSNPDLVNRLQNGIELAQPDFSTFYTPGEAGYTDYPVAEKVK